MSTVVIGANVVEGTGPAWRFSRRNDATSPEDDDPNVIDSGCTQREHGTMVRPLRELNSDEAELARRQEEALLPARPVCASVFPGDAPKQRACFFTWFLIVFLASLAVRLSAQTSEPKGYLIESWQSERGLPQNTVTGIAQTPDGYLWISTLDGLARFDGMRFRLYKAGNTPALGSGRIRFLFTGRQGELWLATQEGGVIQFKEGRFTALPLPEIQGSRPAVIQVAEDESGALWLSTEDGKVGRLADGRYSLVSTNWDPTGKTVFQVRADVRGQLLAVSETGIHRVSGVDLVPVLQGKRGEYVVHCASRKGGWWLSAGGQVRLWREGQWMATVAGPNLPASAIRSGLEDRSGHLWLGTWGKGLFRCGTNGNVLEFTKREGLGGDFVRALCEDNEGNIWVGAEGGGLSRLHPPLFTVYGLAQGLSWEWITSVSEGPDGELWVGTDGYGLNRLRGEMIRPASDAPVVAPLHVMTALADRRGQVWLGTRQGSVYQWQARRCHAPHRLPRQQLVRSQPVRGFPRCHLGGAARHRHPAQDPERDRQQPRNYPKPRGQWTCESWPRTQAAACGSARTAAGCFAGRMGSSPASRGRMDWATISFGRSSPRPTAHYGLALTEAG